MSGRAHARGAMDLEAHVVVARERGLARVDPHAHADRRSARPGLCERALRLCRRCHGRAWCPEDDEEGVALRVHLVAAGRGDCGADPATMLLEERLVGIAQGGQEARGSLDVREQERHGPRRQGRRTVTGGGQETRPHGRIHRAASVVAGVLIAP